MAIAFHKAVADTGGAISTEIASGDVGTLIPEITIAQQLSGVTVSRKFYLKNNGTITESVTFTLEASTPFTAILFEGTGDTQVVGDLTGSETNGSPITFDIAPTAHKDFWIQIDVPSSSTETVNYESISLKLAY